jgi:hydrophobic/amphiphilic exporter-1 (mainly G- bacteria), HAE1 family
VADQRARAEDYVSALIGALRERGELSNVRRADAFAVPAYRLNLRRDNIARFNASPSTVAAYLEAAARGRLATELRTINEEIPIVVRSREMRSIEHLLTQRVPTPRGLMPLSTFAEAELVMLPAALMRTGQAPVVRIYADVAPGSDLRRATAAIDQETSRILPPQIRSATGGAADAFRQSLRAVFFSLLLSLLLVYLILAAQFESLVQPFVILTAVPLAAAGVVMVLLVTGQSVNLMSLTGCVVLVGIVVNDAIIKVDFINQRRAAGMELRQAIVAAGHDRVRPIMMTTLTTVLGLMPLALGFGEGAQLRSPLAIAIAGGLMSATVLTLFVVPVMYSLVSRRAVVRG